MSISVTQPAGTSFDPANPGPIGGTTPGVVNATRVSIAQGTLTDVLAGLTLSATWNDAADTMRGLEIDVTNSASAAASTLLRASVGGVARFQVGVGGLAAIRSGDSGTSQLAPQLLLRGFGQNLTVVDDDGTTVRTRIAEGRVFTIGDFAHLNSLWSLGDPTFTGLALASTEVVGWSSAAAYWDGTRDLSLSRVAAGVLGLSGASGVGSALELREQTAPSAPSADRVRLYAVDNGSGKTQLMALFASGAAQQVAIEP
jgi:hypothetical protein